MKSHDVCVALMAAKVRDVERALGLKVRNGQVLEAVRKTLAWVLSDG